MDESESGRIRNLRRDRCPALTIGPWPTTLLAVVPPDPHHFDGDVDGTGCED
jgi:hypothetical protein